MQRYLEAEIEFVSERIRSPALILELGCGYGRVLQRLVTRARAVVGIDTSRDSLRLARETLGNIPSCHLLEMNAIQLGFCDQQFDMVLCIQNGLSAFKVNPRKLIEEAVRVTRSGGAALFSSYSERFWQDRLEWFRLQAAHGLIGEIDDDATGDGVIICKDGFRATTVSTDDFVSLTSDLDIVPTITEVDGSSIFCEMLVP